MRYEDFRDQVYARCGRTDRGLVVYRSVASSHEAAQHVVREYRSEGSTPPPADLVAWTQTAGRGRDDRSWSSPPGAGAYITMIRPEPAVEFQTLPMRLAVALCRELNRCLGGGCCVRWPNDLMVGEKKIAGILLDLHSQGDEPAIVVISVGVNHAADTSVFAESRATSLGAEGAELGLVDLLGQLAEAVDETLDTSADLDIRDAYEELSCHQSGESLAVRQSGTGKPLEGTFRGFDDKGFLRLEVAGEVKLIASGLVSQVAVEASER